MTLFELDDKPPVNWQLRMAIADGVLSWVQLAVKEGADANWVYGDGTMISFAFYLLWKDLRSGADHAAFERGKVIHCLLNAGARADGWTSEKREKRRSLLQECAAKGDLQWVVALLKHGARVNQMSENGNSALHELWADRKVGDDWASLNKEIILQLLEAGADPLLKNNQGETAADCLKERFKRTSEESLVFPLVALLEAKREEKELEGLLSEARMKSQLKEVGRL